MKWKKDQKFDCETYLQTLAMGIHSPVAEEHVANCNFCRDIYHGGTEEFPLSLKDEAIKMRTEKRRRARRKFLRSTGLVAAGALGVLSLVHLGLLQPGESTRPGPVDRIVSTELSNLDSLYSSGGRPAVESLVQQGSERQVMGVLRWIQDRRHSALYDQICICLGDGRESLPHFAFAMLKALPPASMKPHLALLLEVVRSIGDSSLRHHLEDYLAVIEDS